MTEALREGRRILKPDGIGAIVFAHKGTAAWETLLTAVIDAGYIVTASWPIDTERASRMRANKSAALASSVHLIVRPRENPDGTVRTNDIGEWRDVLSELPIRIHAWMPRLAEEGVVGADAIFSCLGPALEIFSRYSHVEKASGEPVALKEYLEQVWAAVAREALTMIFSGIDTTGFEEDARLTAMWLWTIKTEDTDGREQDEIDQSLNIDEENRGRSKPLKGGFALEYDAARKIAQGLGIHLENLDHLLAVQGDIAVLLPVSARTQYLFSKDTTTMKQTSPKKKERQMKIDFNEELIEDKELTNEWISDLKGKTGHTVLDQVHQSMILFVAGRSEALKRFLVEEGVGRNPLFWPLAQALSALYPTGTDEKRWVDGVLARKKGLGF